MNQTRLQRTTLKNFAVLALSAFLSLLSSGLYAANIPAFDAYSRSPRYTPRYHWSVTPVASGAQILTLIGRFDDSDAGSAQDEVPLIAVLRDRLPDGDAGTDRLRYIWLLTYRNPKLYQKALSAVPFFYWAGDWGKRHVSDRASGRVPRPLLDLSQPTHHVFKSFARDIVQWTAFDPMTTAIRASSRAYGSNKADHERLHVEEAISFLRDAPVSNDGTALTRAELDNVIARLTLTKTLLGGFVAGNRLKHIAASEDAQRSETIGRNWELLRTSAERTGLVFEPLRLADSEEEYAILWFPLHRNFSAPGLSLGSTWKLLHISNPWTDKTFDNWNGYVQTRQLDESGRLLPEGEVGSSSVTLAPLAVYSLGYPGAPLLMVNFRHDLGPKRREMLQRGSNELVMGVLGLSHFANWYYFAGQAAYQFVRARHGSAEDLSERLDAYSEFRVAATLDRSLEPELREELQRRAEALDVNPLGSSPGREVALARQNWNALRKAAADEQKLPARVDRDRREEIANFGRSPASQLSAKALHYLSFGLYSRRAPAEDDNLDVLWRDRRVNALIGYLEQVRGAGQRPEVVFPASQIQASITELSSLLVNVRGQRVRGRASSVILALQRQTKDEKLLASCQAALGALTPPMRSTRPETAVATLPHVTASPEAVETLSAE